MREIDWSQWYGANVASVSHIEHAYSPSRILDALRAYLPHGHATRVLELGSAPGRWLGWAALRLGVRPFGLDLEAAGVRLSRHLYPDIPVTRANAFALPFADASFDAVYALGLIEHFEDPTGILSEARRVLRPGGMSLWLVPNLAAGSFCGWHWRTFYRAKFEAHRVYTLQELEQLVRHAGLAVAHTEYSGVYLPHMQRVMGRIMRRSWLRTWESYRSAANLVVVGRK